MLIGVTIYYVFYILLFLVYIYSALTAIDDFPFSRKQAMDLNRRDFLKLTSLSVTGLTLGGCAASATQLTLLEQVQAVCQRLAPHGWRELLLRVTGRALDLSSPHLGGALREPIKIDRRIAGFEDFALEGRCGIEPGSPAHSLLFHALASPNVQHDGGGRPLTAFPTLAELDIVESYVYGVVPPELTALQRQAQALGGSLAVVVFAREYRTARHTVHRRHADLCFARVGVARVGNAPAVYDGKRRAFDMLDAQDVYHLRVVPVRFAPYLAVQMPGQRDLFGPMHFQDGAVGQPSDESRRFWVPLHKLFAGPECLRDHDLHLNWKSYFQNEKLRRFHQYLTDRQLHSNWQGAVLDEYPFVLQGKVLATLASPAVYGPGIVLPQPHPLAEKALHKGKPIGFEVAPAFFTDSPGIKPTGLSTWFSTIQILRSDDSLASDYLGTINPPVGRVAPEYINARHELQPDGQTRDLNKYDDPTARVARGGYQAQHYIDYTGDGWVSVDCPQLMHMGLPVLPAYVGIAPPDFFPQVSQRELMEWWQTRAPDVIRNGVWCISPWALSDQRMAANITLRQSGTGGAVFDGQDNTVTAIVSHPGSGQGRPCAPVTTEAPLYTSLPDGSNGLFDPGWDFSKDVVPANPAAPSTPGTPPAMYLANYGLGTPFIEDAKLCAALGSFWPAVSPDATRVFEPNKRPEGDSMPWPSIVPLTDEEIGSQPLPDGRRLPWDGVPGPQLVLDGQGHQQMRYRRLEKVDYLNLPNKLTAYLTARVDFSEYTARVLAMAAGYWALGYREERYTGVPVPADQADVTKHDAGQQAKAGWAVASFRKLPATDAEYREALAQARPNSAPSVGSVYRLYLYRYDAAQNSTSLKADDVLVRVVEPTLLFVAPGQVLRQRERKPWEALTPPFIA